MFAASQTTPAGFIFLLSPTSPHRNENPSVFQMHFIIIPLEWNGRFNSIFGLFTRIPSNKWWILAMSFCKQRFFRASQSPTLHCDADKPIKKWKALKRIGNLQGTAGMCLKLLSHCCWVSLCDQRPIQRMCWAQGCKVDTTYSLQFRCQLWVG